MARLLVDYDSTLVRLFFRLYFSVVVLATNAVGTRCSKAVVNYRLQQSKEVPLPRMTGWLQSAQVFTATWRMRSLPGSWLGLMTMLVVLLGLASDFVTTTVASISVQGHCTFGTGLVLGVPPSDQPLAIPPHNGAPYVVAAQAQQFSQVNGGLVGIYKKINRDTSFSANTDDVLGAWECADHGTILKRSFDVPVDELVDAVVNAGNLYGTPDPPYCNSYMPEPNGGNLTTHLIILDTSAVQFLDDTFAVRVSIDQSASWYDEKVLKSYECHMKSDRHLAFLQGIQQSIPSYYMLQNWCGLIQGSMYNGTGTGASGRSGIILEGILNSMMMIAGGQNYLLNTTQEHATQGCILKRTLIPWEVIFLASLALFLLKILTLSWALIVYRTLRLKEIRVIGDVPHDLLTWMAQPSNDLRHGTTGQDHVSQSVSPRDLCNWRFGLGMDGRGYLRQREHGVLSEYASQNKT